MMMIFLSFSIRYLLNFSNIMLTPVTSSRINNTLLQKSFIIDVLSLI